MQINSFSSNYEKQVRNLVVSILENEFGHTGVNRPDLEDIERAYQSNDKSNFWIALENDKVVGTIALLKYKNFNFGVLKRFTVKKEHRNKGVGKKLIETVIEFAKNKKLNSIILQTTTEMVAANKMYENFGFKKIEKPKNIDFQVILPTTVFYEFNLK